MNQFDSLGVAVYFMRIIYDIIRFCTKLVNIKPLETQRSSDNATFMALVKQREKTE